MDVKMMMMIWRLRITLWEKYNCAIDEKFDMKYIKRHTLSWLNEISNGIREVGFWHLEMASNSRADRTILSNALYSEKTVTKQIFIWINHNSTVCSIACWLALTNMRMVSDLLWRRSVQEVCWIQPEPANCKLKYWHTKKCCYNELHIWHPSKNSPEQLEHERPSSQVDDDDDDDDHPEWNEW